MPQRDTVRSWKDPHYRASLADDLRSRLPEHPAGLVEVPESGLTSFAGGAGADGTMSEMFTSQFCQILY